ncbi:BQ2448_2304 [Microbotryum intermedium]|uniref:BQ2448_2304 protein n=1 Tax=Microbotryum intermedium TaxID=269621 RepID=A0A238FBK4_9BASI|nr:BQ2448_2304 [Microbotryum intermedium]
MRLLNSYTLNHLRLNDDTVQAKRNEIMSNVLWSAEETSDCEQWPLMLNHPRKPENWTLKNTILLVSAPIPDKTVRA